MIGLMPEVARKIHVLVIEDDPDDAILLLRHLADHGFQVTADRVDDMAALRGHLANNTYDVIISDYNMPSFTATHALECVRASAADTPFLVISGSIPEEALVSLVYQGASDFLTKDRLIRIGIAVETAIHQRDLRVAKQVAETDQKEAEERLRQAEKMEAIGQLAGGVAHDFNNLLSVILNYSDFVIEGFAAGDARVQDVHEIKTAAERGASLTRQLLAFSRKELIKPQILDLRDVLENMKGFLARTIGEDIRLVVETSPDLWAMEGDRGHVEQVLMNLAVNARDAMPQGGTLTLRASNNVFGLGTSNNAQALVGRHVMLSVTDTGAGMPQDVIGRIFEPFFTTKAKGSGTGLGLATVLGIVDQWQGHVEVRSEEGVGTTFEIFVPVPEAGVMVADEPVAHVPIDGPPTILVVEDEAPIRAVMERILTADGYAVLTAGSAKEALALYEEERSPIDLVITDVVMPGLSGRDLADALATNDRPTKLLFISGYLGDVLLRQGIATDQVDYLPKPFDATVLRETVQKLLAA